MIDGEGWLKVESRNREANEKLEWKQSREIELAKFPIRSSARLFEIFGSIDSSLPYQHL